MAGKTPVILVGGFLGAGKTTFLRRLLEAPEGRRLAVIVNDFGDLNIDAALVAQVSDDIALLTNGCLCCSARGDLLVAARRLATRVPAPEGIVIETSGVARPDVVARSLVGSEFGDYFEIRTVLVLIDAAGFHELDFEAGELVLDQAAVADLVALNKIDLAGAGGLEALEETLQEAVPHCAPLKVCNANVPLALVLDGADGNSWRVQGLEKPGADALFETFTFISDKPLDLPLFKKTLETLPREVYRLKGFIHTRDEPGRCLLVQKVGQRGTIEVFEGREGLEHKGPGRSELVAIVKKGALSSAQFWALFDDCVLPAME